MKRRRRVRARMQPRPQPRKLASRMKFEKYARSRMYAGIHRMRAISRKRTRKEERNSFISDCRLQISDCRFRYAEMRTTINVSMFWNDSWPFGATTGRVFEDATSVAVWNPQSAMNLKSAITSRVLNSQLIERLLRTAVPLVQEDVALIPQIGDAHLRSPESTRCEVA